MHQEWFLISGVERTQSRLRKFVTFSSLFYPARSLCLIHPLPVIIVSPADIRDLISLEDVMSELELGPNGGLIYCMEYLMQNISWLAEKVADYEDDFIVFDCPGQIELYSHIQVMPTIARQLQSWHVPSPPPLHLFFVV